MPAGAVGSDVHAAPARPFQKPNRRIEGVAGDLSTSGIREARAKAENGAVDCAAWSSTGQPKDP